MDASAAFAFVRTTLSTGFTSYPIFYPGEDNALPDTPFVYVDFNTRPQFLASFGGGAGSNTYRNPTDLDIYVFVPRGAGLLAAADLAEDIATLFRSNRNGDLTCFGASVMPGGDGASLTPPGLSSPVNNFYWAAVRVDLSFDQVG